MLVAIITTLYASQIPIQNVFIQVRWQYTRWCYHLLCLQYDIN